MSRAKKPSQLYAKEGPPLPQDSPKFQRRHPWATPLGAWTLKLGEGPGEHAFPCSYEAKFPPMFSLPAMVVGSWWRTDGGRGKGEVIEDDFICVLQFATQLNAGPLVRDVCK